MEVVQEFYSSVQGDPGDKHHVLGQEGEETLWYLRESAWAISGPQRGRAVASMSGSLEEPRGLSLWPRVENYASFTRLGSLGPIKGLTSGQCLTP